MRVRPTQALLEKVPTDSAVADAVEKSLNVALKAISLNCEIRTNRDTKKVYPISLDGTAVEKLLDDLDGMLLDKDNNALDLDADWALTASKSKLVAAIAATYKELSDEWKPAYGRLIAALPMIGHWQRGMSKAMLMRPERGDHELVKEHMALYVVEKLRWLQNTVSWYDAECLYVIGALMEQWGSLRLVSQEGMEAWQKQLNEVLRLSNGYANAGAIPTDVIQKGKAAIALYIAQRASKMPSRPQQVYESALLRQHAFEADVRSQVAVLKREQRSMQHQKLSKYWRRYMVCAAMRCRLRARFRRGELRAQVMVNAPKPAGDYYTRLLQEYDTWRATPVAYTANDLTDDEKRRQRYAARRAGYRVLQEDGDTVYMDTH